MLLNIKSRNEKEHEGLSTALCAGPLVGTSLWIVLLGILAYTASVAVLHRRTEDSAAPVNAEDDPEISTLAPEDSQQQAKDLEDHVEAALGLLNNLAALSTCQLVHCIPGLLADTHRLPGEGIPAPPTPLGQAQALRQVLISAIEGLKAPSGESPQYYILNERYVMGRPIAYIITRLSIGDRTYYRYRNLAIAVVARQWESQEELIRSGGANAVETG